MRKTARNTGRKDSPKLSLNYSKFLGWHNYRKYNERKAVIKMIPILFLTNWKEGDAWKWPKEVCCKQSEKMCHKTKVFSLSNYFRLAEYVHIRQKKKNIWLSKSWWLKCHKNNSFNQRQSYTKLKQIDVVKHFIFVDQPRRCKNLKLHGPLKRNFRIIFYSPNL